ncbi:MAG: hypothetical protein Q9170_007454 [Blastenia crenularia]
MFCIEDPQSQPVTRPTPALSNLLLSPHLVGTLTAEKDVDPATSVHNCSGSSSDSDSTERVSSVQLSRSCSVQPQAEAENEPVALPHSSLLKQQSDNHWELPRDESFDHVSHSRGDTVNGPLDSQYPSSECSTPSAHQAPVPIVPTKFFRSTCSDYQEIFRVKGSVDCAVGVAGAKSPAPSSMPKQLLSKLNLTQLEADQASPAPSPYPSAPPQCRIQDKASSNSVASLPSTPRRRQKRNDHPRKQGLMTLGDIAGDDLMNQMTFFDSKTTLRQFINFIIKKDILLPTEEAINGDRARNAAECELAARIPLESTKDEGDFVELGRTEPGCGPQGGNDLGDIGAPISYYEDPLTGRIRKRVIR